MEGHPKFSTLKELETKIKDRRAYLAQTERDILTATENGAYAIRDLQIEVDTILAEKARLLKQNLTIQQNIREHKITFASLTS